MKSNAYECNVTSDWIASKIYDSMSRNNVSNLFSLADIWFNVEECVPFECDVVHF